jgi:hypothetical protein
MSINSNQEFSLTSALPLRSRPLHRRYDGVLVGYGLQEQPNLDDRSRSILSSLFKLTVIALIVGAAFLLFSSEDTTIETLTPLPKALGNAYKLRVRMTNPQGVSRAMAWIEQNGSRFDVMDVRYPGTWKDWVQKGRAPVETEFSVGKDRAPGLVSGKAKLIIAAKANNLRGIETRLTREIPVVLGHPELHVGKEPAFLRRGGTGVLSFRVSGEWSEAGVKLGKHAFPSYPSKGDPNNRIAIFGFPPDIDPETPLNVYATNLAGNEVTAPFPHHVTKVTFREREIKIPDAFLNRVVPALDPSGKGELPARFAKINSEVRRANDKFLAGLAGKSGSAQLWNGHFQLLTKSSNEARFADFRTYLYKGDQLNKEWHLGVDLASVKNAPLPAANKGQVVFAGPLGIYGNCVVIDHGLGVQSVYGHMSAIQVKEGATVERGQTIGNTGMTGLAGGDHAHIGLQIHGVFVDPVEWSLPKWMDKSLTPLLSQIANK